MRNLRAIGAHSPAIVISLMALVLSLGGGAYAATLSSEHPAAHGTSTTRIAPAAVTFHPLHLINGWMTGGANQGTPSYAVSGGLVYLSGGVRQPAPGGLNFARLPRGARPNHAMYFTVSVLQGTDPGVVGTLFISPTGQIDAFSIPHAADAQILTSLNGIVFPVRS